MNNYMPLFEECTKSKYLIDGLSEDGRKMAFDNIKGFFNRELFKEHQEIYGVKQWIEACKTTDVWDIPFLRQPNIEFED
jgi:hypothetical protein